MASVAASIAIVFLRRPDQFVAPALFAEEVQVLLAAYAQNGLASILGTVNGYHILASQLIALAAFKISLAAAPVIMAALAIAFICAVVVAIATAPTLLRWPFVCALAGLLVPSDPEVFAVGLYAFWWAGLLLALALLWDGSRGKEWLRVGFIVLGGLSSPLVIPLSALFVLRAALERNRGNIVAALLAVATAAVQADAVRRTGAAAATVALTWSDLPLAVNKFAGLFVSGPRQWFSEEQPGFIVLGFMLAAALYARKHLTWHILLLALACCAACLATMLRLQIYGLDPAHVGPRYFFYPLTFLMWLMVWIASCSHPIVRAMLAAQFVLALTYVEFHLSRRHDPIDWRGELDACARAEQYELPAHTDGNILNVWRVRFTGAQCRRMMDDAILYR